MLKNCRPSRASFSFNLFHMPTREVCDILKMSTQSYVVYRRGDGREFLGPDSTQRRHETFVVIVQIQWLCQGGGGPAGTQTFPNFWTP